MKLFRFRRPKLTNTSGLSPSGHAVLLEPYEPEIRASILVIPDAVKKRTAMAETRARVIAVGPQAWRQEARLWGLWRIPRARVGDKVIITAYCGIICQGTADGKQYRMVNDEDLFSIIVKEDLNIARTVEPTRIEGARALRDFSGDTQGKEMAHG